MSDIVSLDEPSPHISGPVVCTRCRHKWVAVRPVGTDLVECSACGAGRGTSLDVMLHKPRIIIGDQCCGQLDSVGVCAAPACLYGDALTLVQCIRDAYHLEHTSLRAENDRMRAAVNAVAENLGQTITRLRAEAARLAAENERMREALREIAKVTYGWEPGVWSDEEARNYFASLFFGAQAKARAALKEEGE